MRKITIILGLLAALIAVGAWQSSVYTDFSTGRVHVVTARNVAWCDSTVGVANGTAYVLAPFNNSVASYPQCNQTTVTEMPMGVACTAQGLYVNASAAGAVGGSGVVTLYQNGSPSALTCTLGTGTSCNDLTHNVAFIASDLYSVRVTTGQATDTTANVRVVFQCL